MVIDGSWTLLLHDATIQGLHHDCINDPSYDSNVCGFHDFPGCEPLKGCGDNSMYAYFVLYKIIVSIIIMNLFVGVLILEWNNSDTVAIRPVEFEGFQICWSEIDPDGTGYIHYSKLKDLVKKVPEPLGFGGGPCNPLFMKVKLSNVEVNFQEQVNFHDLLLALSLNVYSSVSNHIRIIYINIISFIYLFIYLMCSY